MKTKNLVAKATTTINEPVEKVWHALIDPKMISQYMFGAKVKSDWTKGSRITWKGEMKGKPYEDKGEIINIIPKKKLEYTHFSPTTGEEDIPENYHTVSIDLENNDGRTKVSLAQDKNATEKAKEESQKNWKIMLGSMKKLLEEEK